MALIASASGPLVTRAARSVLDVQVPSTATRRSPANQHAQGATPGPRPHQQLCSLEEPARPEAAEESPFNEAFPSLGEGESCATRQERGVRFEADSEE